VAQTKQLSANHYTYYYFPFLFNRSSFLQLHQVRLDFPKNWTCGTQSKFLQVGHSSCHPTKASRPQSN